MKKREVYLTVKSPELKDMKGCNCPPKQEFAEIKSLDSARVKRDRQILINQLRKSGIFG